MKRQADRHQARTLEAVRKLRWPADTHVEIMESEGTAGLIRIIRHGMPSIPNGILCPLTAAVLVQEKVYLPASEWEDAAKRLKLNRGVAAEITLAADQGEDYDPVVRTALLKRLGLKDEVEALA